ncbi:hypothetical protein SADUNF_Sadunf11G0103700 [Salix dunnii]|uniref:25S rRNA (uridine-N(3))-methyltransferase BMT5-like domain-containing protein n=1 Tax=Salix dunnii TaxID=1413687 RepID=A0A835MQR7_9ROSI|nr:hypothetical protein SADUNF_Sadunf11G0103700 [Salix dunnii]
MMLKYSRAATDLREVEELGCTMIEKVQLRRLINTTFRHMMFFVLKDLNLRPLFYLQLYIMLKSRLEYVFIFNCVITYISLLRKHQRLVKGFSGSVLDVLEKTTEPYRKWDIERLAEDAGMCLVEKDRFKKADYPGFNSKRGSEPRVDQAFSAGKCFTFKFTRMEPKQALKPKYQPLFPACMAKKLLTFLLVLHDRVILDVRLGNHNSICFEIIESPKSRLYTK